MQTPQPTKITVNHHGTTVSAELPWDASMEEIMYALDGLLIAQGWPKDGLDRWAQERAAELLDEAADKKE